MLKITLILLFLTYFKINTNKLFTFIFNLIATINLPKPICKNFVSLAQFIIENFAYSLTKHLVQL